MNRTEEPGHGNEGNLDIDRKGRWVRIILGLAAGGSGIWLWVAREQVFWGIGLIVIGAFAIFEGIRGWCALRALGLQTPF